MRLLSMVLAAAMAVALVPSASAQSYTVSGTVVDQDGTPVPGAHVSWYQYGEPMACDDADCVADERDHGGASATTDAAGRFSLAADSGWGDLQVWKEGFAHHYQGLEVGGDEDLQIELLRYPEKSARIEGRITPGASISIENPVYGIYECSQGEHDPEAPASEPDTTEPAEGRTASQGNASLSIAPGAPHHPGCAITVRADGSYAGNVTPGYSIVRVHGPWSEDGPGYYSHSLVRDLAADATTRIDVALTARPGPDAQIMGYVIDRATQQAVPGVQVSFSNQDSHGWANAQTDGDGSYRVALRSGLVQVHVWADGYLPWEGQVTLQSADQRSFDIELTAGESRYGGCCFIADGKATAEDSVSAPALASGDEDRSGGSAQEQQGTFQDLGGGLGPYDPDRQSAADRDTPGLGGAAAIGLLGLLGVALRRR